MARIRTIKPAFFKHEELFDAEQASGLPLRLAFAGLWGQCDRDGRFAWRPRALKSDILPFDTVDFAAVLNALAERGFVIKYEAGGETFGHIPTWGKHQHINLREPASNIPEPPKDDARTVENIPARVEGKGREQEGEGKEEPEEVEHFPNIAPSQASGAVAPKTENPSEEEIPASLDRRRYSADFEDLWAEYRPISSPNATKADAARAFERLSAADKRACWQGLVRYAQWLLAEREKRADYPAKHLATFINRRGWESFADGEFDHDDDASNLGSRVAAGTA